ncbi:MAG: hypothetical protein RSA10_03455 [Bacilli bacterium]
MKSNYNDIIDIILTLLNDEKIADNIAISGSIVPYLILNKESDFYHNDFNIFVKENSLSYVKKELKRLSKEYEFDIIIDSAKYANEDFGFKITYENTVAGFYPYTLKDNKLIIKTFSYDGKDKVIKQKEKVVSGVIKSDILRLITLNNDKTVRIMSPEYIKVDKEMKELTSEYDESLKMLDELCDYSVLKELRKKLQDSEIKITSSDIKQSNIKLVIICGALLLIMILIICVFLKR